MGVIDLGGCIFWGVQPGDSVVDVLMSVPIWLFSHMDQCTLLIGVPSAGRRLLLIIDFQYIWVYMLVPTSCITLAPMFPLWKPLFLFCFVLFSFFLSLCVCFPFWKCIHPMKFSVQPLSYILSLYLSVSTLNVWTWLGPSLLLKWHYFIISHGWEVFHCVEVPHGF